MGSTHALRKRSSAVRRKRSHSEPLWSINSTVGACCWRTQGGLTQRDHEPGKLCEPKTLAHCANSHTNSSVHEAAYDPWEVSRSEGGHDLSAGMHQHHRRVRHCRHRLSVLNYAGQVQYFAGLLVRVTAPMMALASRSHAKLKPFPGRGEGPQPSCLCCEFLAFQYSLFSSIRVVSSQAASLTRTTYVFATVAAAEVRLSHDAHGEGSS